MTSLKNNTKTNNIKSEQTIFGTKFKKNLNVDEISDFYFDMHNLTSGRIIRIAIISMLISSFILTSTYIYLLNRNDSVFYATSGDGKVWELNTRETPEGSFDIKRYKMEDQR